MTRIIITLTLLTLSLLVSSSSEAYCFEEAGDLYNISPQILWAIAKGESNFNSNSVNWNTNGSYDYGLMQINSGWAKTIGYENWAKLSDPCFNVKTGAWVLAHCIKENGYNWDAVGCYNATSKSKRAHYANYIYKILAQEWGRLAKEKKNMDTEQVAAHSFHNQAAININFISDTMKEVGE